MGSLRISASYLSFPAHVVLVHLSSIFLSFHRFCHAFLELLLEPCRYPSDIFLSSRPRTRLATAYIRPLGMVEARWVNVKNTHTHKHTPSMRVAYKDKNDRTGLRGYVQFNKHTHTHTDDARYICCCDNKHRYI